MAPLCILAAGLFAYHNSFSVPFLFDADSVLEEPRMRNWGLLWRSMLQTTRPLSDLSFAVNDALGGFKVVGYHFLNLSIHLLAALTLYGLVRLTVLTRHREEPCGLSATSLALAVLGSWHVVRRLMASEPIRRRVSSGLLAAAVALCSGLTIRRNVDYRSDVSIWADTVAKQPRNARAHNTLGAALAAQGRLEEAARQFAEVLRLQPGHRQARAHLDTVRTQHR